ncbi:MAG: hypothetical protein ACHQUA_00830 [Microgenomates group bacterium]
MGIERTDLYDVPADIAQRLEPVLKDINSHLLNQQDFPHQHWHGRLVARDAVYTARMFDLKPDEVELTRLIAENHDEGYRLVTAGVLKPEEHHFGSYLIAKAKYADLTIANGVLLHIEDVIPEEAPFPYSIVRNVDRLHSMGWGGFVRTAYYLGFKPFNLSDKELAKSPKAVSLFETRTPDGENAVTETRVNHCFPATAYDQVLETDFEARAKRFAWMEIMPFLHRTGQFEKMDEILHERSMAWLEGEHYYKTPGNHFVPKGEEYKYENVIYTIEPIGDVMQRIFGAIIFNHYDAEGAMKKWKQLHPDGILKDPKTEYSWAKQTWNPYI